MRNKPPTFKGRFDPEGALTWKESMEKIFRAMVTNDDQKVRLATHMLAEEAKYWWTSTRRRIEASGEAITSVRFKNEFLKKYFPEDLRNKKEAEFLNLKQRSMLLLGMLLSMRRFRGFVLTSMRKMLWFLCVRSLRMA